MERGRPGLRDRGLPRLGSGTRLGRRLAAGHSQRWRYGFAQSSNYNSRPRAAEVLVDEDRFAVVRKRETPSDLLRLESIV